MQHVEELLKSALSEVERVLSSKTVVGEPITVEGHTLIPLISIGFGFCAGGIKPIAVVVASKDGVRVEPIRGRRPAFSKRWVA